jgi:putative membrane protein
VSDAPPAGETPPRSAAGALGGIFIRGLLMGAADVVPGVSGGTIAFITGIYDRLLGALSAFGLPALRLFLAGRWGEAFRRVDGAFLLVLLAGIATSVATLAHLIGWLLEAHPVLLWAFFFGLIAGSALWLLRRVPHWNGAIALALAGGLAAAAAVSLSPAVRLDGGAAGLFFAGFLAICAMILPGVSGSFILVLLGMYDRVLAAVESFDVVALGLFAAGAACGLLTFSRFLHWLLHRFHGPCMGLLTGFLAGSLLAVWPWKLAADGGQALPVLPGAWAAAQGAAPQLLPSLLLMIVGAALVWQLERRWGDPGT